MIFLALTLVILLPLLFIAGMARVVSKLPHKMTFWSTFVLYLFMVMSSVGLFTSVMWLVLELGWTK